MKPAASSPWRKALRREQRGVKRGRRTTHRAETQEPRPGSSWDRRHWWQRQAVASALRGESLD